MKPIVWCSCGWELHEQQSIAIAVHVPEMIRHWRQGHAIRCLSVLVPRITKVARRFAVGGL